MEEVMIWHKVIKWVKSNFFNHSKYDYLRKFSMLIGLTDYELHLFSQIVHERKFKSGEVIYQEQFPLAVIYLIFSGSIEVKNDSVNNPEAVTLHKHQFYGIIDMYNEKRRMGQAIAKTDAILLAVSNVDFKAFINANPRTGVKIMNNICKSLSNHYYQFRNPDME